MTIDEHDDDVVAICRKIKADYDSGKITKNDICDMFDVTEQHQASILQ